MTTARSSVTRKPHKITCTIHPGDVLEFRMDGKREVHTMSFEAYQCAIQYSSQLHDETESFFKQAQRKAVARNISETGK